MLLRPTTYWNDVYSMYSYDSKNETIKEIIEIIALHNFQTTLTFFT
jgi:hypothetical protein